MPHPRLRGLVRALATLLAPLFLTAGVLAQGGSSAMAARAATVHYDQAGFPIVASKPAMYFAVTSVVGRPFAKDPSVVHFKQAYYLYFTQGRRRAGTSAAGTSAPVEVGTIGIARSTDRIHWTVVGELAPTQAAEGRGIAAPGARVIRGQVHLFYQGGTVMQKDAICHAVSDDGVHFQKDVSNPVYHPTEMPWSIGRAIDAEVFVHGDSLFLFFATRDPTFKRQLVGLAKAPLASDFSQSTWTDVTKAQPVLAPDLPWEGDCIEAPTFAEHGGLLYLFYAGSYNNSPQQIGVATSTDGLQWTRMSDHPLLANGAAGAWNQTESGHPGILQDDDGQTYLYYQGSTDAGRTYFLSVLKVKWEGKQPVLVAP